MNKYEQNKAKFSSYKKTEKLKNKNYFSFLGNISKLEKIKRLKKEIEKQQYFKKTKNFKNNQNYIKGKKFDSKFFKVKFFYFFISTLLINSLFLAISIIVYILFFNSFFKNSGFIFKENLNYYYLNINFIFFYFTIGILSLLSIYYKNTLLKKIGGDNLQKNYSFLNDWKKKIFFIFLIFLGIFFLLYYTNFLFAIKIFILGFFILNIHLLFEIKYFSKEKNFIKQPFLGYTNIFKSIEKNNIIIRNYRKVNKNKVIRKEKLIYFITVLYLFLLLIFGFYLFTSIGKNEKISNYFISINLDNLVKNEILNLENKNLGNKSINIIFTYLKTKNLDGLKIGGNNYNEFIFPKEEKEHYYYSKKIKKINYIDYGDVKNYYKNSNLDKLLERYHFIQRFYKKISFANLDKKINSKIDLSKLEDKYYFFKYFYLAHNKKINKFIFDFDIKNSSIDEKIKNIIKTEKNIENLSKNINSKLKLSKKNFLLLLNSSYIYSKGFKVEIQNAFKNDYSLKEKINFFLQINNPNIDINFFNLDYLCEKNKKKIDCNILKQKFYSILDDNKKDILLNNNYIISNYLNKYLKLYLKEEYKKAENQQILLDIYFKLKNRKTKLVNLNLGNNYIKSVFLENLILKYPNLKTIRLGNVSSDKENIILDLTNTNIENFYLLNSTSNFIVKGNPKEEKNILIYPTDKRNFVKKEDNNYIYLKNGEKIKRNNLFNISKYSNFPVKTNLGHYKFSNDFFNGLYTKNRSTYIYETIDYFYVKYFDYIFKNKKITQKDIDHFLEKYKNDKYFKIKIDYFLENTKKYYGGYSGLTYEFNEKFGNLNKDKKIVEFFKYMLKSEKIKKYIEDYTMFKFFNVKYQKSFLYSGSEKFSHFNNLKFSEVIKIGNIYFFVYGIVEKEK